jgi:hypothetical protein
MQRTRTLAALTAAAAAAISSGTQAQVSEEGMGKIVPVELYVCQLMEGKGRSDLDAVIGQWNQFMDERDLNDYAAWILTPYFFGTEQSFDLIWMGAASNGETMFDTMQKWIMEGGEVAAAFNEGGEVAAAFNEVVDCPVHMGLGSAMYKAPPKGVTSDMAVIAMSDCEMNEGTRYSDVRSAELEWATYLTEQDTAAAVWHWFPNFGGGDQDYDYKLVYAYASLSDMGADWEMRANGGGAAASREIFGDLDDCDDSRVYLGRSIRNAQLR